MPSVPSGFPRLAILTLAFVSAAAPMRAQAGAQTSLTLDAALERALASNPAITAARLARPVAAAGRGVAGERPNPEATYEAEREAPKQSIGISLPLELGGKRQRRIDLAVAGISAADAELQKVIADVRAEVRRAYFELAGAGLRVTLANDLRALAARALDAARARLAAGDVPRQDVVQIELTVRQADNEVTAARGEVAAAAIELNALLGQPPATPLTVADDLGAGALPSLEDAVARTSQTNAELALFEQRIREQIARRDLAKALLVPDAAVGGSVTYDAQPEFSIGWRASVTVTLPLFTRHQFGVILEDAELVRLRAERDARLAALTGAVTAARARAEAAREQVTRYQTEILPLAAEVDRMAQDAYSAGQSGLPALLTALQQTRDIRRQGVEAGLEYQRALAELERAIGAPVR